MPFTLIEPFNQQTDYPVQRDRTLNNQEKLNPAFVNAMRENKFGWCYGVSANFMRYCNENNAFQLPTLTDDPYAGPYNAQLLLEYEDFLVRQLQALRANNHDANFPLLTIAQAEALSIQTLQGAASGLMEVECPRNVWAFSDYYWGHCSVRGDKLHIAVGLGHAIEVDLTMRGQGVGFIFDPEFGLFRGDATNLLTDFIREHHPHVHLVQSRTSIRRGALEAIFQWWNSGREGREPTCELGSGVARIVSHISSIGAGNGETLARQVLSRFEPFNPLWIEMGIDGYGHFADPDYRLEVIGLQPNPKIVLSGGVTTEIAKMGAERASSIRP